MSGVPPWRTSRPATASVMPCMAPIAATSCDAIAASTATVVEHLGRITGYATGVAFFAHAVGETNPDLKALIGAARAFAGPTFWCRLGITISSPGASRTVSALSCQ
jgi:hypothetical protein